MFKLILEKAEDQEIKPVNSKGNQRYISIGKTDAEAEAEVPALWQPDIKSKLIEKSREFQKSSIFALLTMPKPLTVWNTVNCGKF